MNYPLRISILGSGSTVKFNTDAGIMGSTHEYANSIDALGQGINKELSAPMPGSST